MNHPVIQRELVGLMRTRKAVALQIAVVIVFSMLVLVRWPTDTAVDLSGTQARQVFQLFGYGLLATMLILVPVFPATTIVREKIKGTLALLLNSPMSSSSLYFGKLVGVMGFAALLMLLSVPAVIACYAMGGIDFRSDIVPLYGVLTFAMLQYAAVGLFVGTLVNSTDSAMRITYGCILALAVMTLGPILFLQGQTGYATTIAGWLACLSPITALMEVVGHGDIGSQGIDSKVPAIPIYLVTSVVSMAALAAATIGRLNFRIFDQTRDQGVITDELSDDEQWSRRLFFLIDPQRRKGGTPLVINPVMVKEFRCRRFGRAHWLIRMIMGCVLVSLLLTIAAARGSKDWGPPLIGGIMVLLQVGLIAIVTPSLAAGLISTERESGGWQLLQMTRLSWYAIAMGKLMSVAWTLGLILLATLPGYCVLIYINPQMWPQIWRVLVCLFLAGVFSISLSSLISSLFRRTAVATTVSFGTLLAWYALPMLIWLGRDAPFGHQTVERALALNPMAAALTVMKTNGFTEYNLLPFNWFLTGGLAVLFLIIFAFQTWRLTRPS